MPSISLFPYAKIILPSDYVETDMFFSDITGNLHMKAKKDTIVFVFRWCVLDDMFLDNESYSVNVGGRKTYYFFVNLKCLDSYLEIIFDNLINL
ncbi:hypothetical protein MAR_025106 [Mya arenaria]|uniref:Uncharacterized protein n=1 Tax=Mya arenaria TaxID=6604 RepID=A0ABY7DV10_MYAAR|nr:hypothetical protein MAR_025106 [Mya arenaria]